MSPAEEQKYAVITDVTASLAERATALRYQDLNARVRTVASQCFLDFFGVALAGSREPLVQMMLANIEEDGGARHSTVIGHSLKATIEQTAWLNGAMAHALDFDDVHMAMPGHPSVAIAPAVLALGEWRGIDGRQLITAFTAGVETACRVGLMTGTSHYAHGWHPTATVGTIGAAAAAANLLGLDARKTAYAIGIAATQAAGLKSAFGTMCKPMHAGHAAATGIQAARLAMRGFTSNPSVLDVDQGFISTQSTTPNPEAALRDPPGGYYLPQILFKYHATCYFTHSAIEALNAIRIKKAFRSEDISRVVVHTAPSTLRICNILEPKTGLEAKFSLRLTSALALLGEDTASENVLSDSVTQRPDVLALRDKIEIEPRQGASETAQEVIVHFSDGAILRQTQDVGIPAPDLIAQGERLRAKFITLASPLLEPQAVKSVIEACDGLTDAASIAELCKSVANIRPQTKY